MGPVHSRLQDKDGVGVGDEIGLAGGTGSADGPQGRDGLDTAVGVVDPGDPVGVQDGEGVVPARADTDHPPAARGAVTTKNIGCSSIHARNASSMPSKTFPMTGSCPLPCRNIRAGRRPSSALRAGLAPGCPAAPPPTSWARRCGRCCAPPPWPRTARGRPRSARRRLTVRDIGPGFRWTTSGRTLLVAVTVPDDYTNAVEIIFPLTPAVTEALPVDPAAPTRRRLTQAALPSRRRRRSREAPDGGRFAQPGQRWPRA